MPPKSRHVDVTDSIIVLAGVRLEMVQGENGYSTVQTGRSSERKTETKAESAAFVEVLSDLDKHIMFLERVARQPHLYDLPSRPIRAITGSALYHWVAGQTGLGVKQVQARLDDIEQILKRNELAHVD